MESFSTKKKFYDLKCAEKQNQIQGCKATHRAGTTNTCAGTHTHTHSRSEGNAKWQNISESSWQDTEGVKVQLQEWYIIHLYTNTGQKCWFSSALADLRTETGSKGPTTCDTIHKSGTSSRKLSVWRRCYSFHNEGYHLEWRTIW